MIVQEVTENLEDPIFGNTSSHGPIGSIKSVCGSSLKSKVQICKQNFFEMSISSPFLAAKTAI